jgi:GH25 family lysozyme M1 (1,4-beta-N-acetylmuramidase)
MGIAQFVDISSFQGTIDFVAYRVWAASFDGIARIAMKSSEGTTFIDPLFKANREAALAAGIDCIYYYHYGRPSVNTAVQEAKFMHSVVGDVRPQDLLILDFEENTPNATSDWAYAWLAQQEDSYDGKLPGIYASSAYIAQRLQDQRLNKYPLWLANWQFSPNERPPVPAPWTSYEFVQYTDAAQNIPGINATVDADIFLGGNIPMTTTIPAGWTDDGQTLTAPNKIPVIGGFRDHILADSTWSPDNWPLRPEYQANPVEESNAKLGAGAAQEFRWKRLGWCAELGIYESWLGQELHWYQTQFSLAQQQIAALEKQIAALNGLPSVANLLAVNALAVQIVQKTQVQ